MVLEAIINGIKAEKHPFHVVLVGFFYASLSILLSMWVFKEQTSMVMLFLTCFAVAPLMMNLLRIEEQKDIYIKDESKILKEHFKAIFAYGSLFLGFTIAFSVFYVFLPRETVFFAFKVQSSTIASITGHAFSPAVIQNWDYFMMLFMNNVKVLIFCVLFSLLYGLGAIFVLTWNASVIGTAVGILVRNVVAATAAVAGASTVASYFKGFGLSVVRYSIHGIPEIGAYIVAGIAGGIISVAIVNHDLFGERFEKIVFDSANLFVIALFLLLIAAVLEAWVTPYVFGLVS